jgi:hypothetical protein
MTTEVNPKAFPLSDAQFTLTVQNMIQLSYVVNVDLSIVFSIQPVFLIL